MNSLYGKVTLTFGREVPVNHQAMALSAGHSLCPAGFDSHVTCRDLLSILKTGNPPPRFLQSLAASRAPAEACQ